MEGRGRKGDGEMGDGGAEVAKCPAAERHMSRGPKKQHPAGVGVGGRRGTQARSQGLSSGPGGWEGTGI